MKCPRCNEECDYPTVDIGVGEIQCGAASCDNCYWVEGVTAEEQAELDADAAARVQEPKR